MKAIVIFPEDMNIADTEIDVPLASVDDPTLYQPESLYPAMLHMPGTCPQCSLFHLITYIRKGFRIHDDGQIAVYEYVKQVDVL